MDSLYLNQNMSYKNTQSILIDRRHPLRKEHTIPDVIMRQCRAGLCEDDVRVTWLIPMTIRRFFTVIIMIFALFCHFAIVQTRQFAKESVYPAGSLQSKGHGNPSWMHTARWAHHLCTGQTASSLAGQIKAVLCTIRMKHIAALENESWTENGTFFSTAMSGRFISLILYLHV